MTTRLASIGWVTHWGNHLRADASARPPWCFPARCAQASLLLLSTLRRLPEIRLGRDDRSDCSGLDLFLLRLLFWRLLRCLPLCASAHPARIAEGAAQPEQFGSIPSSLWWALITWTTIGYGDAFPVTPLGKVLAGLVAIAGIGLIALPSGILASAFSEIDQRRRKRSLNRRLVNINGFDPVAVAGVDAKSVW